MFDFTSFCRFLSERLIRVPVQVDNRWVVPYNAQMLMLFDGHVNVEECRHISGGLKYVVKYLSKGYFIYCSLARLNSVLQIFALQVPIRV